MEIAFDLVKSDLREARIASLRMLPIGRKVGFFAVILIGVVLFLEPIVLGMVSTTVAGVRSALSVPVSAFAMMAGLIVIGAGWAGLVKAGLRAPTHRGSFTMSIGERGLVIRAGGQSLARDLDWSMVRDRTETKKLILLGLSRWQGNGPIFACKAPRGFVCVIPKRALTSSQLDEFRSLLLKNVPGME